MQFQQQQVQDQSIQQPQQQQLQPTYVATDDDARRNSNAANNNNTNNNMVFFNPATAAAMGMMQPQHYVLAPANSNNNNNTNTNPNNTMGPVAIGHPAPGGTYMVTNHHPMMHPQSMMAATTGAPFFIPHSMFGHHPHAAMVQQQQQQQQQQQMQQQQYYHPHPMLTNSVPGGPHGFATMPAGVMMQVNSAMQQVPPPGHSQQQQVQQPLQLQLHPPPQQPQPQQQPLVIDMDGQLLRDLNNGNGKRNAASAHVEGQPIRPLSAYNFFFADEREKVLKEAQNSSIKDEDAPAATENGASPASGTNVKKEEGADDDNSKPDGAGSEGTHSDAVAATVPQEQAQESFEDMKKRLLGRHVFKDRTKRRPHRKTHGSIGFTALSKIVGGRWRALPEGKKQLYRDIAAADLDRYQKEVAEFNSDRLTKRVKV